MNIYVLYYTALIHIVQYIYILEDRYVQSVCTVLCSLSARTHPLTHTWRTPPLPVRLRTSHVVLRVHLHSCTMCIIGTTTGRTARATTERRRQTSLYPVDPPPHRLFRSLSVNALHCACTMSFYRETIERNPQSGSLLQRSDVRPHSHTQPISTVIGSSSCKLWSPLSNLNASAAPCSAGRLSPVSETLTGGE